MKILLVPSVDIVRGAFRRYVPYGLLALQAASADYSATVDILRLPRGISREQLKSGSDVAAALFSEVDLLQYDVVGFSTVTTSFYYALKAAEFVRRHHKGAAVIFGGPFVTKLAPDVLKAFPVVDAIFVGEAEHSFAAFLERCDRGVLDFTGIAGVSTRSGSSCSARTTDDLDRLPFIARARDFATWFQWRNPLQRDDDPIPLEATRGCPLQCSFCSTRQVWGARVRRKSPNRLLEEMVALSDLCGGSTFFNLIGDNVGVPRAPFIEFCDEFAAINPGFTWGCSLKVDRLEREHLERMWAAGMRAMFVGLESGNQETLDKVRKKTNIDKEIANILSAVDLGFRVTTSFIVGFPWEEPEDIYETYQLHCELLTKGVERSQINVLCPIPGTDIVSDGRVVFEPSWLALTHDGVATPEEMGDAARQHPTLFSHFGRYATPRLKRRQLVAMSRAADTFYRVNREAALPDWNVF